MNKNCLIMERMKNKLKELFYSEDYKLFWELYKSQGIKNITFDFNRFITESNSNKKIILGEIGLEIYWDNLDNGTKSTKLFTDDETCLKWKNFDVDVFGIINGNPDYLNYNDISNLLEVELQSQETLKYLNKVDDDECLAYIPHDKLSRLIIKIFEYNDR